MKENYFYFAKTLCHPIFLTYIFTYSTIEAQEMCEANERSLVPASQMSPTTTQDAGNNRSCFVVSNCCRF